MPRDFLIYGAYGYTGQLVTERAVREGLAPVLAGRDPGRVASLAAAHGLEHRALALADPAALDAGLRGMRAVIHCAGPFSHTSAPMAQACLRNGVHYLDITGEIAIFEALAAQDAAARQAGVMLLPGCGFDVVPSDCLAAHLGHRLPGARRLALAFRGMEGLSRGTALTTLESLSSPGSVRRDGRIQAVPAAWRSRRIDFGDGPVTTTTIPWGDVATAWYSTGIPDIEVYAALPAAAIRALKLGRHLGWLLGFAPVQALLRRRVLAGPAGPDAAQRQHTPARLWGEAVNADRDAVRARLRTPNGYTLTAMTAVEIARRAVEGEARPGFHTPSQVFGADFILEFEGTTREDL